MGVESHLADALAVVPEMRLPNGQTYVVQPITLADLLRVRRLIADGATDAVALATYLQIAARCVGAPRGVVQRLSSEQVGAIVTLAQAAVEQLATAMQDDAPAGAKSDDDDSSPIDLAEVGVNVSRAYRVPFSAVLQWSAADVLVAAWSLKRDAQSTDFRAHQLRVYAANLTATAFHEPNKLREEAQALEAKRPDWDASARATSSGSFDDFAAMAMRMGAV